MKKKCPRKRTLLHINDKKEYVMKKIKLEWAGGLDTFMFDLRKGEMFSYEQDRDALHEKFGGKCYYASLSGLSGAGWIEAIPELVQL